MWDAEDYNGTEAEIVVVQAVVNTRWSGNQGTKKGGGKRVGENTELWSSAGRSDHGQTDYTMKWQQTEEGYIQ